MPNVKPWERALIALAAAKVVLGVVAFAAAAATRWTQLEPRHLLLLAHVLAFAGTAVFLLSGAPRDRRAVLLGASFALTASSFADVGAAAFQDVDNLTMSLVRPLFELRADAFTAYFFWRFVAEFPRLATFQSRWKLARWATQVAMIVGVILFVICAADQFAKPFASLEFIRRAWSPFVPGLTSRGPLFWAAQYIIALPAFPVLVWRTRNAQADERRRGGLLVAGLVVGTAPALLWVTLSSLVPGFSAALPLDQVGWVIYPCLLSTPFTTAWAVVVHEALDARLVARRAVQYALARMTLVTLALIPIVLLLTELYRRRNESMSALLTGFNGGVLVVLLVASALAIRGRRAAIEWLDRRFFREQYDSRRILADLVPLCGRASSRAELALNLTREIDRAMHLVSLHALFIDARGQRYVAPAATVRHLDANSRLAFALHEGGGIATVDFEHPSRWLASLGDSDRNWLIDAGARLLISIRDSTNRTTGFLALGEKRSGLPFSDEDRLMLSTVSSAAGLALAYVTVHSSRDTPDSTAAVRSGDEPATECSSCNRISEVAAETCSACGGVMYRAPIPRLIAGKFRLERRLGTGGMGVVYQGEDLSLNRAVAIKTLPELAPDQAMQLRREARAMAAVVHPNLATIYGSESWHGVPILIVEYLPRGTLAQRLANGPMSLAECLQTGITLCDVIGALHQAGILHRDVKPSNIGFASDGTLKLLDFGLAHLLGTSSPDRFATAERTALGADVPAHPEARVSAPGDGRVFGTLLYLSPEAVIGEPPDPSFDTWSICVVLFEALTGQNPAQDTSPIKTALRIEGGSMLKLRSVLPDAPAELAEFFDGALALDHSRRPASAAALRAELMRLTSLTSTFPRTAGPVP